MNLSHPFRVTLGQIVVDSDHMHSLALQSIEIGGQRSHQRLSLTGLHLRDTALMHDNASNDLYPEMLHVQNPSGRLPHRGISLGKQVVQSLPLPQPFLELRGFILQILIG